MLKKQNANGLGRNDIPQGEGIITKNQESRKRYIKFRELIKISRYKTVIVY